MSSLPLPVRLAAGLAAVALERARKLPQDAAEWPMSAVSQALQLSMRVQQRITELAIKGDEALAGLREAEEDPPWAVFDEDLPAPTYLRPTDRPAAWSDETHETGGTDGTDRSDETGGEPDGDDRSGAFSGAFDEIHEQNTPDDTTETTDTPDRNDGHAEVGGPDALPGYPGLSLPSVRARLRRLTAEDLDELLAYERGHDDRPEFVRMLTNRIATVRTRG